MCVGRWVGGSGGEWVSGWILIHTHTHVHTDHLPLLLLYDVVVEVVVQGKEAGEVHVCVCVVCERERVYVVAEVNHHTVIHQISSLHIHTYIHIHTHTHTHAYLGFPDAALLREVEVLLSAMASRWLGVCVCV